VDAYLRGFERQGDISGDRVVLGDGAWVLLDVVFWFAVVRGDSMARSRVEVRVVRATGREGWCLGWQLASIWMYETVCGEHVILGPETEVCHVIPEGGVLCERCRRLVQRATGLRFGTRRMRRRDVVRGDGGSGGGRE